MISVQTMMPHEYKENHVNFKIIYGFHSTPFGHCLIGIKDTDNAVLHLTFTDEDHKNGIENLKSEWPLSELEEDVSDETQNIIEKIFSPEASVDSSISVLLKGTEFQIEVWKSLMLIPKGTVITYEKVASNIGRPKATRAVGNAVMKNNIAYLLPCHRVIGKSGNNKYKWGTKRKENILTYESNYS